MVRLRAHYRIQINQGKASKLCANAHNKAAIHFQAASKMSAINMLTA
jgi:hypothetical protein